jgi:exopolysaccharide production protein ExoQ
MIDKCAIVLISVCVYASIVSPLLIFVTTGAPTSLQAAMVTREENKIFWPMVAAISVVLALLNRSRLSRLAWPPHIICLFAYFAFAGASVLWAFRPELSFLRFVLQGMVLSSIVLPAMLAARTTDIMRGLFLCFAFGLILHLAFMFDAPALIMKNAPPGYSGYFAGKNTLGQFAGIALLLALHEVVYSGFRRALGIIVVIIATLLLFLSNSKTSLGFAVVAPFLAGLTLIIGKRLRISPAIVILSITGFGAFCFAVSPLKISHVGWYLFGDVTFTGRTLIWDFALYEIGRKLLLGWGYQSFWLIGPDAPSVVEAPGWVKTMPNAHNGYLDTMLEMGVVGFAFLIIFLSATLHAIGRVVDRDPARAWLLLSLALFVIFCNLLESLWMRGFEFLWVIFVMAAGEAARYWQPLPPITAGYRPKFLRPQRRPVSNAAVSAGVPHANRERGGRAPSSQSR